MPLHAQSWVGSVLFAAGISLSPATVSADVLPPKPTIPRTPVLAVDRQPSSGGTVAVGAFLAAAIAAAGLTASRFPDAAPRRRMVWAGTGVAIGVLAIGTAGTVWLEHRRAADEQRKLTQSAEAAWKKWEEDCISSRQNRPEPPRPVILPPQPVPAEPTPDATPPELGIAP